MEKREIQTGDERYELVRDLERRARTCRVCETVGFDCGRHDEP